jgi:hypothetical protein
MILRSWLFGILLVFGCGPKERIGADFDLDTEAPPAKKRDDKIASGAKPAPLTCEAQPDFRYEYMKLPPYFAAEMPAGHEHLFFAPGMFKQGSVGYWSYVFSMNFDKPIAQNAGAHERLLDHYYKGLVNTVGKGQHDLTEVKSTVRNSGRPREYLGSVKLFDAFGAGNKIDVNLRLFDGPQCVLAIASVQPLDADVWQSLIEAASCLPCQPQAQ